MVYIALIISLVAIGVAWKSNQQNKELRSRITHLHDRIYSLKTQINEAEQRTQDEITALKMDVLKAQGSFQITGNMSIREIKAIHPQAMQVLSSFHIGGCSSCAIPDESQRLDLLVAQSGRPVEPVLVALNTLIAQTKAQNGNGLVPEKMLKTPNVQLMF